jgi:SAM-dependent methyltransferase
MRSPTERALIDAASRRYRAAGPVAQHFARGKLRHDPVYFALLRRGGLPDPLRLVDLGCGQGILLALLLEARSLMRAGRWPGDWPRPPSRLALRGIERWPAELRRARSALGAEAEIDGCDLRVAAIPACDVVTGIDVLHYLEPDAQEALLARIHRALAPGGELILRVSDGSAGLRGVLTRAADRLGAFTKGGRAGAMHVRPIREWLSALEKHGFEARAEPMSEGTPFANVWIVARA